MRVTITTLSGVEVARPDIDATHQVGDLLSLLPSQVGGTRVLGEAVLRQHGADGFHALF